VATEIATNGFWLTLYRSILMYTATFNLGLFGFVFFYGMLFDAILWARLVEGKDMIAWWLGANASVLGFHFYTRGKEREAAVTREPPPSPVANTIKAIAPKPKRR
jgi:hypothetical protein